MNQQTYIQEPPIHILSSLVTIALDIMWSTIEIGAVVSVVGVPAIPLIIAATAVTCFLAVALIQRFVARDDWGAAVAKGFAMGVIAGVPYPFTGTLAGSVLLSWAGLHAIEGKWRDVG